MLLWISLWPNSLETGSNKGQMTITEWTPLCCNSPLLQIHTHTPNLAEWRQQCLHRWLISLCVWSTGPVSKVHHRTVLTSLPICSLTSTSVLKHQDNTEGIVTSKCYLANTGCGSIYLLSLWSVWTNGLLDTEMTTDIRTGVSELRVNGDVAVSIFSQEQEAKLLSLRGFRLKMVKQF